MSEETQWEKERARLCARVLEREAQTVWIARPEQLLLVRTATIEEAPHVHAIMRAAFGGYDALLDPPSGALMETVEETVAGMRQGGALLAWLGETPVGSVRFRIEPELIYIGRLAVLPEFQGRGIGVALLDEMERIARLVERPKLRLGTRMRLEQNVALYRKLGYELVETHPHPRGTDIIGWLEKRLPEQDKPPQ